MSSKVAREDLLVKSSLSAVSSLMGLQLFSRLFTFILNQALFRMASPSAFGTAAIQFELMLSTILFLSREGIRNSLLRVKNPSISTTNLSVLPLLFGFVLALASSCLYSYLAGDDVRCQEHFGAAIGVYVFAALMELVSEPLHNKAMAELRTDVRVKAEGFGITLKTGVTFLGLLYDTRTGKGRGEWALLAFAGGQFVYAASVLCTYLVYYGARPLWLKTPLNSSKDGTQYYFDPEILRLSLTMTSQSFLKHFLTEGDKLILSWFSPLQDQGGYAIAVNYGSLIARIVFQPIEETSRVFFSKVLGGAGASHSATETDKQRALHRAANILISLLSVQAAFSVYLLVFGTTYIPILVQILLPKQFLSTSAPSVLSAWVWYIPVLAFNGGLEAFVSSVATPQDLNNQSRWMAIFSAIYIASAVGLYSLHVGDASLVYANIINLSVRIVYSAAFISSFFASRGARNVLQWNNILPNRFIWAVAGISTVFIRTIAEKLDVLAVVREGGTRAMVTNQVATHLGLGGLSGLLCIATWWASSGRYLSLPQRSKSE